MLVSDVFASAYLKYDTHPRMTWCSATVLRSYPIPLLLAAGKARQLKGRADGLRGLGRAIKTLARRVSMMAAGLALTVLPGAV